MNISKNLILVFSVFLLACESGNEIINPSTNAAPTKDKFINKYPGKSHAAVEMDYAMKKNIVAGEEVEVIITFTNTKNVDYLEVNFRLDAGLESVDLLQQKNFGTLTTGQTSIVSLPIRAENNGLYYIYVVATLVDDKRQSRSFAIPINVGNVNVKNYLKSKGNVKIDASGRRIISMPAQMSNKTPVKPDE